MDRGADGHRRGEKAVNQLERQLVQRLSDKLEYKFARIETHRKPSVSPRVREFLQNKLGYVPVLQPELDMVLWEKSGGLAAVEVKAFNASANKKMHPFYEGIGQALALHRLGFDHAALWFLFFDVDLEVVNRYGAEAWIFAQIDLKLPLDFTYFRVVRTPNGDFRFNPMQYSGIQAGFELLEIDDPDFTIHFRYQNPMKDKPVQRAIRQAIELWLNDSI